jgi:hypothetical protein
LRCRNPGVSLVHHSAGKRLSAELDRDIRRAESAIEEQRFSPRCSRTFRKIQIFGSPGPGCVSADPLSRADIAGVPKRLQDLAAAHELRVREISPDVNNLTDASGRFLLRLSAVGQFKDLRGFMIDVGSLPFLRASRKSTFGRSRGERIRTEDGWRGITNQAL